MDFVRLENEGKHLLEQFPAIKRMAKRIYQVASYTLSREKIKVEGNVTRVSPDDRYEYYYGYYDKSPWDASDRYMIALKVRHAYKSVAPHETGIVGVIDTAKGNKFRKIGITHSWNVQQGCMAQWLGPDFKSRIIYNDFRDGKYCSVIFNLRTKSEERVLPLPVYDVARDGSFALSLDFSRLHRMRPGYGYSNIPEKTKGELCPDKPCIWKMDLGSGEVTELFKYTDMAAFEPDESMVGAEHKVNHLMISPSGKRFMVLHRWFKNGRKHTRLVTVNVDKTEMYNLSDDVFVSHCYWKNDEEILSFLRKKETGDHYYLMKDKTQEYEMLWPELNTDGHCSYSPDGKYIITDTYPNRKRIASVYLCTEDDNRSRRIARVFAPFRYDNDCRCDLHPRWNRAGDKICIDSVHEGKRGLYVIDLKEIGDEKPSTEKPSNTKKLNVLMINTVPTIYDGITMTILNYITNMDLSDINMGFVAINHMEDSIRDTLENIGVKVYELTDRNSNQLKYMLQLAKIVREGGYSLVHAHGNSATLAIEMMGAWLGGAKVRCPHSHNTKCAHNRMHKLLKPFFDLFYTHGFACGIEAGKWLYQDKPFVVLKNGTNTSKYAFNQHYREEYRKKLGIENKVAVGHVAHFTYHKNHEFLIRVFKEVVKQNPSYVLVLVGSGKYEDDIKAKVKEYGMEKNVIFTGTSLDIPQILSAMDFMVLPSLYEGLPNVVIEWQASGLPVLLSDTITKECEMSDLLEFIPLDESVWIKKILNMPTDIDRTKSSLGAIASIREAGYDIKEQANVLKKYYFEYAGVDV